MKSEKEKMLAGELYDSSDPHLENERKRARRLVYEFNGSHPDEESKRTSLIQELIRAEGWFKIEPPFHCDYGYNIEVGTGFYANFNCVVLDVNKVKIGRNVMFGPGVQIYTAGHPSDPQGRLKNLEFGKQVTIGDNVWIGGGVIICPGVKIGSATTIGAGSVVTRDVPEKVVAAGNPCRVLKAITAGE
ncbi:MAG: sugar O-acetyltransferase [Chitinispirillaceae bacterium]